MIKRLLLLLAILAYGLGLRAQITTDPSPVQMSSKNLVIYFHADQGGKELAGLPSTAQIFAHTGVILQGQSEWSHAPAWGDNSDKYRLEYVESDLWRLNIGSIADFYGLTGSEVAEKLCFVFRTADKSAQTRPDFFVDVAEEGLQVSLNASIEGNIVTPATGEVTFTASATSAADISITVGTEVIASAASTTSLTGAYTFATPGSYTVTATATDGDVTVSTQMPVVCLEESKAQDYPGGTPIMGPVKNADGSVTFCLAAPGKTAATLVGSWSDLDVSASQPMAYQDLDGVRYFWTTVTGLDNTRSYLYYFLVDGTVKIGDPYARLVLDPQYDKYISSDVYPGLPAYPSDKVTDVCLAVYQGNLNDYDWQTTGFKRPAKESLVIYEMLFRDFTGTEGKALGNGTVKAATEKIPYIKSLGVNCVELLPINEFNGNISWGYNPNFYFAPDKAYGTPDDYKAFIDACHAEGIAVVLDVVFNQSDWQHPWYQLYGGTEQSPFYNVTAPHAYSVLNDWNQGYPLVQQQWKDVLTYWLEQYHVDGFRFDLVKGLGLNDSYADAGDAATNAYNASRVARMKELQGVIQSVSPGAYCINENLAGAREENEMAESGELNWANINGAALQFAKGYKSDSGLERFYAPDDQRTWGSTVSYLESHDEQRLAYAQETEGASGIKGNLRYSMRQLGCAAAQMLMAPGAHMIWMFSELGNNENTKYSQGNNTDPKKVLWSYYDNDYRRGLYDTYATLNSIRTENPEMFAESAQFSSQTSSSFWEQGRTMKSVAGNRELITVINPSSTEGLTINVAFTSTDNSDYKVLACSYGTAPQFDAEAGTVTLERHSFVVLGSSELTGVGEIEAESAVKVTGETGAVRISGAYADYTVWRPDGAAVASGKADGETVVSLAPGIYLVRVASKVTKVAVR